MSDGFSFSDIMNLNKLLNNNNEEEVSENQFYSGKSQSVLNPGNIMKKDDKKEIAQPFAKIEAKVNNRLPAKINTEIWTDDDFKEESIREDGRPKPQIDVLYKQSVKSEDIYLGLSGKSNSSLHCDQLLVKIWLPNTNLKEIGLELKEQSIHLQTPNYLLNHTLPYKVDKDNSDAKWDKEKGLLLVTLKVVKENVIDQMFDKEIEN